MLRVSVLKTPDSNMTWHGRAWHGTVCQRYYSIVDIDRITVVGLVLWNYSITTNIKS